MTNAVLSLALLVAPIEVERDVEYCVGGGRSLRLHIVRPAERWERPLPVVVFIHGGGWMKGTHDAGIAWLQGFVRRGYFGVSAEYRLSGEARFPAQIQDVKCAIRYLRAHARKYRIDTDRIAAWGDSAGGHLAALLGTSGGVAALEGSGGWPGQSSRVRAVVDFYGPTDFLRIGRAENSSDTPGSAFFELVGGPVREKRDLIAAANPIAYVSKDDAAFLIVHGDADDVVPVNQSTLLHEALRRAGVRSTLKIIPGGGHGGLDQSAVDPFLDRELKGRPAADTRP